MFRKLATSLIAGGTLLLSPMVFAQAPEQVDTVHYEFDGTNIDGERLQPQGDRVSVRGSTVFPSLMQLRRDFHNEIIESAGEI